MENFLCLVLLVPLLASCLMLHARLYTASHEAYLDNSSRRVCGVPQWDTKHTYQCSLPVVTLRTSCTYNCPTYENIVLSNYKTGYAEETHNLDIVILDFLLPN